MQRALRKKLLAIFLHRITCSKLEEGGLVETKYVSYHGKHFLRI